MLLTSGCELTTRKYAPRFEFSALIVSIRPRAGWLYCCLALIACAGYSFTGGTIIICELQSYEPSTLTGYEYIITVYDNVTNWEKWGVGALSWNFLGSVNPQSRKMCALSRHHAVDIFFRVWFLLFLAQIQALLAWRTSYTFQYHREKHTSRRCWSNEYLF